MDADINKLIATPSMFSDWVFRKTVTSYYTNSTPSDKKECLKIGQYAHEIFEKDCLWLQESKVGSFIFSDWELIYCDTHDGSSETLYASRLRYNLIPFACKPDVVFRNRKNGHVLILERKSTQRCMVEIPGEAWPNIRAQLWCYGWIDNWLEAPKVILVCQFLNNVKQEAYRINGQIINVPESPWVPVGNIAPSWDRSNLKFHRENLEYFKEYGGNFTQ